MIYEKKKKLFWTNYKKVVFFFNFSNWEKFVEKITEIFLVKTSDEFVKGADDDELDDEDNKKGKKKGKFTGFFVRFRCKAEFAYGEFQHCVLTRRFFREITTFIQWTFII